MAPVRSRCGLCALLAAALLVYVMLSERLNEHIEHTYLKQGSRFHDFMHTSKNSTVVPTADDLIVFVHIPRTSGETLKISLFNDLSYQFNPEWMDALHCGEGAEAFAEHDYSWLCKRYADKGMNDEVFGPPAPWPTGSGAQASEFETGAVQPRPWEVGPAKRPPPKRRAPASQGGWGGRDGRTLSEVVALVKGGNVVQGFWSRSDIERLKELVAPRRVKLWTVLRHPLERSLSFFHMANATVQGEERCRLRVPWAKSCAEASYRSWYSNPPIVRNDIDAARQQALSDYIVSYGHDTQTHQLADQMHARYRVLRPRAALAAAQEFLKQMDYVGFFEDMLSDMPRLQREIFPHAQGSSTYSALYKLGALVGYPRMHTLKYTSHLEPEERELLEAANALDAELYSWARDEFGKGPLRMHETYRAFAKHHAPTALVAWLAFTLCCHLIKFGLDKRTDAQLARLGPKLK